MLCHVSVHSSAFGLRHRARDPISVAYFDRVALFSDFNHLFELLGPGFAPYSSSAFYLLELSSKNILKTLTANFMNNFQRHVSHTKMQSLSESREWSKMTKPIFSNFFSKKRYFFKIGYKEEDRSVKSLSESLNGCQK